MFCCFEMLTALPMDISPKKGMYMQKSIRECLPKKTTSVMKNVSDHTTH